MGETWEDIGSRTARGGFENERDVAKKFNNWREDEDAQYWLRTMSYNLQEIAVVSAEPLGRQYKADLIVDISQRDGTITKERISCKKQNRQGYNHIERRTVDFYVEQFGFSELTRRALKKFCGEAEYSPQELVEAGKISQAEYRRLRDTPLTRSTPPREGAGGRFFLEEISPEERSAILEEFTAHLNEIFTFIIKGEGEFSADWLLITMKPNDSLLYYLEPIEHAITRAKEGGVRQSRPTQSSFKIGAITVQRKGGTGGATNLQFKWTNIFPH